MITIFNTATVSIVTYSRLNWTFNLLCTGRKMSILCPDQLFQALTSTYQSINQTFFIEHFSYIVYNVEQSALQN